MTDLGLYVGKPMTILGVSGIAQDWKITRGKTQANGLSEETTTIYLLLPDNTVQEFTGTEMVRSVWQTVRNGEENLGVKRR